MPARSTNKKAARTLKKAVKKMHPVTKAVAIVCLILGIGAGALACYLVSRGDGYELRGETAYSLDLGAEGDVFLYEEEGADAVCFGRDVSGKLKAETKLEKDAEGRYIVPLDKEGVYTITYTVDCFKFGEKNPNGAVKRIRTFTVTGAEEDGHNVD